MALGLKFVWTPIPKTKEVTLIHRTRRTAKWVALVAAFALAASACNNADPDVTNKPSGTQLTGRISGDGSSTVFPITEAVAEEFQKQNPEVEVTVGSGGTGAGFKKFCNDETDIQDASRPVKDSEKEACAAKPIEYIELSVANDGLAVVVNKKNTWAKCLTTAELKKIWEPNSKVASWKDVRVGFPDTPMKLFGPGTDSGTFDYFTEVINGKEDASRTDYTPSEDDNILVQGVQGSDGALGYFGFAYYYQPDNRRQLNLVGVDSGAGCVSPSNSTVQNGTYKPLSRPLFIYIKKTSLTRPEVRAFVDFYLKNVSSLLTDVGYTPLAANILDEQKGKLSAATKA